MPRVPLLPARLPARLCAVVAIALVFALLGNPEASSDLPPPSEGAFAAARPGSGGVAALVVGDFGTGGRAEWDVAEAMAQAAEEVEAAAIITTGDNLYVDDVGAAWSRPFGWVEELGIPVWVSWGNHDLETPRRVRAMEEAFAPPGSWYRRDLGRATILFLDANRPDDAVQLDFLRRELRAVATEPVVVVFHQPPFSCSREGGVEWVRALWVPLFERYGVDLVLNGHDHNYQRIAVKGVTYVVAGAGGRSLYRVSPSSCPPGVAPDAFDDDRYGFVVLGFEGERIEGRAYTTTGDLVDAFAVSNERAGLGTR